MCKIAQSVRNYTQSTFFHVPCGKFYTWLKTFTQPAVVMVVTNMRCATKLSSKEEDESVSWFSCALPNFQYCQNCQYFKYCQYSNFCQYYNNYQIFQICQNSKLFKIAKITILQILTKLSKLPNLTKLIKSTNVH